MEESSFCYAKGTEGVALSGTKDFIRTDLWRDHLIGAEGAIRVTPSISQAKGQSMQYNIFFNIVLFCIYRGQIIWFGLFIYTKIKK